MAQNRRTLQLKLQVILKIYSRLDKNKISKALGFFWMSSKLVGLGLS